MVMRDQYTMRVEYDVGNSLFFLIHLSNLFKTRYDNSDGSTDHQKDGVFACFVQVSWVYVLWQYCVGSL